MLTGLYPPITTPFDRGRVDTARLAENIERWNQLPIDGYVVLGSNGEAPLLEEHERSAVVRAAYEAIPPDRTMIVGAGRESTEATIRSVREAFELGADAALVGVPTYYRPAMSHGVLRDHYLRVADASPGPVLLYSVPFFTGLPIAPELFADLIGHERIAGIKESARDAGAMAAMSQAARRTGKGVSLLVGTAGVVAEGIAAGATGAVVAVGCVASTLCARIIERAREGRQAEAVKANRILAPLAEAVTVRHGIGGLKAALDLIGFHGGVPRPPLPPASPEARAEIAALISALAEA